MSHRCIYPRCPPDCCMCNHAVPDECELVDAYAEGRKDEREESAELLKALELIASLYDYEASCGDLASRLYEARCIANAAIAKATGEQS